METFWRDLQLALRMLAKKPGFTVVAVMTLALGIAVNATMFSLVSAFLLKRPLVHDPDGVVVVSAVNPRAGFLPDVYPISAPNYLDWREANHVFAEVAAADEDRTVSLTAQGQPEALRSAAVSPNYFSVLGVAPELGRSFANDEDRPGRDRVAILSHELWERRLGADPSRVGSTVRLNREDYTVVGIMPTGFRLLGFTRQVWTPRVLTAADQTPAARKERSLRLFARLKPGVTLEQARAEISMLARRAEKSFPETEKDWGAAVRTLPDFLIHSFYIRTGLAVMMTSVGFVLMIACANVAGLLLARAAGRRKELAIRIALGAGRWDIIRQLLTEGLVISFLGGSAGLLLAYWGVNFTRANLSTNEEISAVPLSLDGNVLLFALGVSLVSAVLCGLAPAVQAGRTDVATGLKGESRAASAGRGHSRLRRVLVTAQVALALFLLTGTGLLVCGLLIIAHQDLGFRPEHVLTAGVDLDAALYKDPAQQTAFVQEVLRRLEQIPGAEAVAATSDLPATGADRVPLQIEGQPELPADQRPSARDFVVTADYLRAAGIPFLRGRTFTVMDQATAPRVVLVNQVFVHRFLNDQEPLGKRIRLDVGGAAPEWSEIVGVVGNVKSYVSSTREDPEVYESYSQRPAPSFSLMLRASADPSTLAPALRAAVAQVDAELPLTRVMSMSATLDRMNGGDRFFSRILGSFAVLALLLAAIGIYGLIAYSVGQRTHEIGIRMALGAGESQVLRLVLGEGMKVAAWGATIGFALALPLPKLFEAAFYDLKVREPLLHAAVPVVTLLVAAAATYIPARRAARVDPLAALRQE